MPYHGSPRCHGCSGEDCCCCEVFLEEQADQRAAFDHDPADDRWDEDDNWDIDDDCDEDCDDDLDESMDGDFDTGMASAGFGTDEDYGGCGGDWD